MADSFAQLLGDYIRRADLSMNEVARATGVDTSYVSRLCRGDRLPPRRPVVLRLAAVLQLTPFESARLCLAAGYAPDDLAMLWRRLGVMERALLDVLAEVRDTRALLGPLAVRQARARRDGVAS